MSSSKVVGIIPARYGSTRLPGKLLIEVLGKTILQRTYENVLQCSILDELIIATDDERIFNHVKSFGGNVVMTSSSCPTGTDRLAEVIHHHKHLQKTDVIINVQGDEPCMAPSVIEKVILGLIDSPKASVSTAVHRILHAEEAYDPSSVKCVIDQHGYATYFSRGLIPFGKTGKYLEDVTYYKHIGIYGYRPQFLMNYVKMPATPLQIAEDLEQLKVLENGYHIKTVLVDEACIGVDTHDDVIKLEKLLICKQNLFLSPAASVPHWEKA